MENVCIEVAYLLRQNTLNGLLWLAFPVTLQLLIPFLEPEPSWLPTPREREKEKQLVWRGRPFLSYLVDLVISLQGWFTVYRFFWNVVV
jgi:hypothetical protein